MRNLILLLIFLALLVAIVWLVLGSRRKATAPAPAAPAERGPYGGGPVSRSDLAGEVGIPTAAGAAAGAAAWTASRGEDGFEGVDADVAESAALEAERDLAGGRVPGGDDVDRSAWAGGAPAAAGEGDAFDVGEDGVMRESRLAEDADLSGLAAAEAEARAAVDQGAGGLPDLSGDVDDFDLPEEGLHGLGSPDESPATPAGAASAELPGWSAPTEPPAPAAAADPGEVGAAYGSTGFAADSEAEQAMEAPEAEVVAPEVVAETGADASAAEVSEPDPIAPEVVAETGIDTPAGEVAEAEGGTPEVVAETGTDASAAVVPEPDPIAPAVPEPEVVADLAATTPVSETPDGGRVTEPDVAAPVEPMPVMQPPAAVEPMPVMQPPAEVAPMPVLTPAPPVTEPVVTEPVAAEPVVTEPVVTEPVVTGPVVTEPVGAAAEEAGEFESPGDAVNAELEAEAEMVAEGGPVDEAAGEPAYPVAGTGSRVVGVAQGETMVFDSAEAPTEHPAAEGTDAADGTDAAEGTDADAAAAGAPAGGEQPIAHEHAVRDGGWSVGSAAPIEDGCMPLGHPIKGVFALGIYQVPGSSWYEATIADVWFTDEGAAEAAGFRRGEG